MAWSGMYYDQHGGWVSSEKRKSPELKKAPKGGRERQCLHTEFRRILRLLSHDRMIMVEVCE